MKFHLLTALVFALLLAALSGCGNKVETNPAQQVIPTLPGAGGPGKMSTNGGASAPQIIPPAK